MLLVVLLPVVVVSLSVEWRLESAQGWQDVLHASGAATTYNELDQVVERLFVWWHSSQPIEALPLTIPLTAVREAVSPELGEQLPDQIDPVSLLVYGQLQDAGDTEVTVLARLNAQLTQWRDTVQWVVLLSRVLQVWYALTLLVVILLHVKRLESALRWVGWPLLCGSLVTTACGVLGTQLSWVIQQMTPPSLATGVVASTVLGVVARCVSYLSMPVLWSGVGLCLVASVLLVAAYILHKRSEQFPLSSRDSYSPT